MTYAVTQYIECRSSFENPVSTQPDFKKMCKEIYSDDAVFTEVFCFVFFWEIQ